MELEALQSKRIGNDSYHLEENQFNSEASYTGTLRRKSIGPFADFSYKMAIFKRLEKYLKLI